MIAALMVKTIYEVRFPTLIFAVAVAAVETMLAYVLPTFFHETANQFLHVEIIRNIISALLGAEIGDMLDPSALAAIAWVHPILLSLVWAQEITFCTRLPAGEIDRGTIDVLLGQPVSRMAVILAETLVWLAIGTLLVMAAMGGHVLGRTLANLDAPLRWSPLLAVGANFAALYAAVGGVAWLVSAACDRRGRAVAIALAALLASFFVNFLAPLSGVAERLSFLSVLNYYRPWNVLRTGDWPIGHVAVLLLIGAALWAIGLVIFCRRDICTV